ncbi:MAG: aminopeptidase [Pelolinea sp.]|nr:aminopeptidase [Pelolinea sp.]
MFDTDKRWKTLGEVFVNKCLKLQPGEKLMIAQEEPETWPLALATYEAAIKAGGYPQIQLKSAYLRYAFMKYGTEAQYSWVPEIEALSMDWADCYVALRGGYSFSTFHDISADVLAKNMVAHGKVSTLRWQKTRWLLSRVPNETFAQHASLDLETVVDMYFDACLMDYEAAMVEWREWAKKMVSDKPQLVHITGKNTDLEFEIDGRTWVATDLEGNIPGGEVGTTPINNEKLNGQIYWENPGVFGGRLIPDMCVEWKKGKLVKATSSKNEDFLNNVLSTDEGASLLGEFAFGTNKGLKHFTNDILWDEKIYGTLHIAFGRAYPQYGGENKSAIHWDVVKEMRNKGGVTVDGKYVMSNGDLLFNKI